jgi:hypothetical protein
MLWVPRKWTHQLPQKQACCDRNNADLLCRGACAEPLLLLLDLGLAPAAWCEECDEQDEEGREGEGNEECKGRFEDDAVDMQDVAVGGLELLDKSYDHCAAGQLCGRTESVSGKGATQARGVGVTHTLEDSITPARRAGAAVPAGMPVAHTCAGDTRRTTSWRTRGW